MRVTVAVMIVEVMTVRPVVMGVMGVFFPEQNGYYFLMDIYPMNCFSAAFSSSMAFCC